MNVGLIFADKTKMVDRAWQLMCVCTKGKERSVCREEPPNHADN